MGTFYKHPGDDHNKPRMGKYKWRRLDGAVNLAISWAPNDRVVLPPKIKLHKWTNCCTNAALDLIDFTTVWGFEQQISLVDWKTRAYGDAQVDSARRQFERVKARLRDHGISVATVPPAGVFGRVSNDFEAGDLSWFAIVDTEENRAQIRHLITELDYRIITGEDRKAGLRKQKLDFSAKNAL